MRISPPDLLLYQILLTMFCRSAGTMDAMTDMVVVTATVVVTEGEALFLLVHSLEMQGFAQRMLFPIQAGLQVKSPPTRRYDRGYGARYGGGYGGGGSYGRY